jgi:hypothetical protein
MIRTRALFATAFLVVTAAPLLSPSYLGRLRGLHRDQSGASVVGAQITLLDETMKVTRFSESSRSDSSGACRASSLRCVVASVKR